jgi:hypothetical protein
VIPLIIFTSDRQKMGEFVNRDGSRSRGLRQNHRGLNVKFLADFFGLTASIQALFN